MGFIRNALIGVALYEVARYLWKKNGLDNSTLSHDHEINRRKRTNFFDNYPGDPLAAGSNPEVSLTGVNTTNDDDPWKNSLANDDLRAPDS
jgi:hypothetical protein